MAGQDRPVVETLWSVASQQDSPLLVVPPPRQVAAEMKIKTILKALKYRKFRGITRENARRLERCTQGGGYSL